ncbi:MAG: hypothetical protein NVSMB58_35770 [Terriglobales bacterium]
MFIAFTTSDTGSWFISAFTTSDTGFVGALVEVAELLGGMFWPALCVGGVVEVLVAT